MTLLRLVACAALCLVGACAFTTDFDRFQHDPDAGPDSGSPDSGMPPAPLPCAELPLVEGTTYDGSTDGAGDDWSSSCGGNGSPDRVFEFTAPVSTWYRITTDGSAIDTVLSVRHASCDAATERGCNDNHGVLPTSEVVLPLDAGERVLIVVDGNAAEGPVQLLAERIACPATNLLETAPINHTSVGRPDDHASPCGGAGAGDASYRFVPESDGFYAIRATKAAATTRTAVAVEAGPVCGGPLLQCNTGEDGRSEVVRYLHEGEPVTVWVDGREEATEGSYQLVVEERPGLACGESGSLDGGDPLPTTLPTNHPHGFTTSCASTSVWWYEQTDPADIHDFPDRTFTFDAPEYSAGCSFWCDVTVNARFPFAAALLEGTECSGPELECHPYATVDSTDPNAPIYQLTFTVSEPASSAAPTGRTLVLERLIRNEIGGPPVFYGDGDDFTIEMSCAGIC